MWNTLFFWTMLYILLLYIYYRKISPHVRSDHRGLPQLLPQVVTQMLRWDLSITTKQNNANGHCYLIPMHIEFKCQFLDFMRFLQEDLWKRLTVTKFSRSENMRKTQTILCRDDTLSVQVISLSLFLFLYLSLQLTILSKCFLPKCI